MKLLSSLFILLFVLQLARSDSLRSKLTEKLQVHGECGAFGSCPSGQSCDIGRIPWTCYDSPRAYNQPCTLVGGMHDSCKSGLTCAPGHHRCYNSPRQEGEPCEAGNPCGNGLNCAPSDAPYHKCKKMPDLNDDCDPVFNKCRSGLRCLVGGIYMSLICQNPPKLYEACDPGNNPCQSGLKCVMDSFMRFKCYCSDNSGCENASDVYGVEVLQYGYHNPMSFSSSTMKTCDRESGLCFSCETDAQCTNGEHCILVKQAGAGIAGSAWYKACLASYIPPAGSCIRHEDCQNKVCTPKDIFEREGTCA